MTRAEFDALFASVSNWGRWGRDDQRGTLNLITRECVLTGDGAGAAGALGVAELSAQQGGGYRQPEADAATT